MNTVDKQLWDEFERDGWKYPHQKNFKRWVENGCKPVVPDSYYKASEKVRQIYNSGISIKEIGKKFDLSDSCIRDLMNEKFSHIGRRAVNKVLE